MVAINFLNYMDRYVGAALVSPIQKEFHITDAQVGLLATAFLLVYAIARRIPPGRTRTYGDIAEELGDKGLARAVGQALGLNPFAPVVPCHRALRSDGSLGGYYYGLDRKRWLLRHEGARPR